MELFCFLQYHQKPGRATYTMESDKLIPYWVLLGDFVSLTRTPEELSIIC